MVNGVPWMGDGLFRYFRGSVSVFVGFASFCEKFVFIGVNSWLAFWGETATGDIYCGGLPGGGGGCDCCLAGGAGAGVSGEEVE
jgi:hypothetical protein